MSGATSSCGSWWLDQEVRHDLDLMMRKDASAVSSSAALKCSSYINCFWHFLAFHKSTTDEVMSKLDAVAADEEFSIITRNLAEISLWQLFATISGSS